MICEGSITLNLYCTAALTCENKAKVLSMAAQESGRAVEAGVVAILPSSYFGHGGMLGQGEGRTEKGKRAFAISSRAPINRPSIILFSCFLPLPRTPMPSSCISSLFNSVLNCLFLASKEREGHALVRAWLIKEQRHSKASRGTSLRR